MKKFLFCVLLLIFCYTNIHTSNEETKRSNKIRTFSTIMTLALGTGSAYYWKKNTNLSHLFGSGALLMTSVMLNNGLPAMLGAVLLTKNKYTLALISPILRPILKRFDSFANPYHHYGGLYFFAP